MRLQIKCKQKNAGEADKKEMERDEGDFNPTSVMETENKPKVLKTINTLTKEYTKY